MNCSTPGLPVHHQLLEFTQAYVHWVGDAIRPSHPLSSPSPPAPNPSQHQSLFQWVNSLHEVAKVLEFQLQHQSFQWTPKDLLAVQHHSSKASILQCSAFFTVQLSHAYMTTGETIALTRQTFVGKVISLLFNMLSRLVITFFSNVLLSDLKSLKITRNRILHNTLGSLLMGKKFMSRIFLLFKMSKSVMILRFQLITF